MAEKRLSIKIVGHGYVYADRNPDYTEGSKQPLFKGDGVAVWVHEKKEKPKDEVSDIWKLDV